MNPLTIGGLITIALLTVALGLTGKWAQHEAGKRAKAEASMRQWQATAMECSDSVGKAEKAAKDASKRAQDALKAVRAANASSEAQKRALDDSKGKGFTCEGAVAKVKEGLK